METSLPRQLLLAGMTFQARATSVTDPRDRIYSILGIAHQILGGRPFLIVKVSLSITMHWLRMSTQGLSGCTLQARSG